MKTHKATLAVIVICFMGLALSRCRNVVIDWKGGVIDRLGQYHLANDRIVILVSDSDHLLHYEVKNQRGETVIKVVEHSSLYQKWMLYWDSNDNLWVVSSDIGDFVWKKATDGTYKEFSSAGDSLQNEMPSGLKLAL